MIQYIATCRLTEVRLDILFNGYNFGIGRALFSYILTRLLYSILLRYD